MLDMVCGEYIQKDIEVLSLQGRLAIIGSMGGTSSQVDFKQVMIKRLTVGGTYSHHVPIYPSFFLELMFS